MADFLDLTETELISFAHARPPVTSDPPEERRYQAAYVDNDAVTTDWPSTLTVIAHS